MEVLSAEFSSTLLNVVVLQVSHSFDQLIIIERVLIREDNTHVLRVVLSTLS